MKKRLSALVCLCLLSTLFPGAALAAGGEAASSEPADRALTLTDPAWELSADGSYYALKNVPYCTNVVNAQYQYMNVYVPAAYLDGGVCGGYTAETAPVVLENNCMGWRSSTPGSANAAYLAEGFVFVSCGARSRGAEDGTGKMPAPVVDLKAAVRCLRLNDGVLPGDKDKIVSVGTSGGGQMSSILGASGNMDEYYPYLYESGAAGVSYDAATGVYASTIGDDVFGAMCFCPIADLDNADLAYAWLRFDAGETSAVTMFSGEVAFSPFQLALQDDLAAAYCVYLNGLGLVDEAGEPLSFDPGPDGGLDPRSGSFYRRTLQNLSDALNAWIAANSENGVFSVAGGASAEAYDSWDAYYASLRDPQDWLRQNADGSWAVTDLAGFLNGSGLSRNKDIPGFDTFFATEEGNGFGAADEEGVHFSASVAAVLAERSDAYAALDGFEGLDVDEYIAQAGRADIQEQAYLMNATRILLDVAAGSQTADPAPHWRTRNGTADEHTSFSVAYNLCCAARMAGAEDVDYALVWNMTHGSNEGVSTGTFIDWVHSICGGAASGEASE